MSLHKYFQTASQPSQAADAISDDQAEDVMIVEPRNEETSCSQSQDTGTPVQGKMCNTSEKQSHSKEQKASVEIVPPQYVPPMGYNFPQTSGRRCKRDWFGTWKWLHYVTENDSLICYQCMTAERKGLLKFSTKAEKAFISTGFRNWKKATGVDGKLNIHQQSSAHKEAVMKNGPNHDCSEMLNKAVVSEKKINSDMLLKIVETLHFLGRQGLAIRGSHTAESKFNESNSNFIQLMLLRANDDDTLKSWLQQKKAYTSPDIQNSILQLLAHTITRSNVDDIKRDQLYTIMVDETTDVSNKEQAVICIRHVGEDLIPREDFIGLYELANTSSNTLLAVIKDTLTRLGLRIEDMRGQCYDGAATMKGSQKGVAAQIVKENPKAVYIHCYGHSLNLAVQDSVKGCKVMKDTLDISNEVIKLIKRSPKRQAALTVIKTADESSSSSAGIRTLCPTRWTVKTEALESVLANYKALMVLWDESLDSTTDSDVKVKIVGVQSKMRTFHYFFGLKLCVKLFCLTDNLSRGLQAAALTATEGMEMAKVTVLTLDGYRREADSFISDVFTSAEKEGICAPSEPRPRKRPARYEEGSDGPVSTLNTRDELRRVYLEAIDLITSAVNDRFDRSGYKLFVHAEQVLLKGVKGEEFDICSMNNYARELNLQLLVEQLKLFSCSIDKGSKVSLQSVVQLLQSSHGSNEFYSEICKLVKLLLLLPATNASSERSFSQLRRLKSYLRSTMTQQRLNHVMTLSVFNDTKIEYKHVVNLFIDNNPSYRLKKFTKL